LKVFGLEVLNDGGKVDVAETQPRSEEEHVGVALEDELQGAGDGESRGREVEQQGRVREDAAQARVRTGRDREVSARE
jgi:hypothetical protein